MEQIKLSRRAMLTRSGLGIACLTPALSLWLKGDLRQEGASGRNPVAPDGTWHGLTGIAESPAKSRYHEIWRELVPRDKLRLLLSKLCPSWPSVKTGEVLHALRLWGVNSTFESGDFYTTFSRRMESGRDLIGYFIDTDQFTRLSNGSPAILVQSKQGIKIRTAGVMARGGFAGTCAHPNDFLCTCAELEIPSTTEISCEGRKFLLADMVRTAALAIDIREELEWTIEGLARYLWPYQSWRLLNGTQILFNDLVARLLDDGSFGGGSCLGTHRLTCLAAMHSLSHGGGLISGAIRRQIGEYLSRVADNLNRTTMANGVWAGSWWAGLGSHHEQKHARTNEGIEAILTATGHHLEWLGMCEEASRLISLDTVREAVSGVLELCNRLTIYEVANLYSPITHLCRGLCLLCGETPHQLMGQELVSE